ncbi:MAG: hypothetical protein MI922_17435 [Bacteroidales bacterium]|nr:hypothetical protein [Bacteroidales bacterium]
MKRVIPFIIVFTSIIFYTQCNDYKSTDCTWCIEENSKTEYNYCGSEDDVASFESRLLNGADSVTFNYSYNPDTDKDNSIYDTVIGKDKDGKPDTIVNVYYFYGIDSILTDSTQYDSITGETKIFEYYEHTDYDTTIVLEDSYKNPYYKRSFKQDWYCNRDTVIKR